MGLKKTITIGFNIALFLYLLANNLIVSLFQSSKDEYVIWDKVYNWSPVIGFSGALMLLIGLILTGAILLKSFWNRFLSDVFNLRHLTFNESLSIVLIIAILSS